MNDAMRQKLASYGVWTYRSAWALEITAAAIGLLTGIALGAQAFRGSSSATEMDFVLASAPFIIVALAELTKIPIATLLFSAKWIWKPILLLMLMLLAGITFETVFFGLERAATLRLDEYTDVIESQKVLKAQLDQIAEQKRIIESDQAVETAQKNIERVSKLAEDERQSILAKIANVDKELEGQVILSPQAADARDKLQEAETRKAEKIKERDEATASAYERFKSQRDSFTERLKNALISPEQRKRTEDALEALKNPVPALTEQFRAEIASIDDQIAGLRTEFEQLRSKSRQVGGTNRSGLENQRAALVQSIAISEGKWSAEIAKANDELSKAQTQQSEKSASLYEIGQTERDLTRQYTEKEQLRIKAARNVQILRVASRFLKKKVEDVTEGEANLVSLVWFGSMAGLAALAGPVCAIVALGLQRIGLASSSDVQRSPLGTLVRKTLLSWRWRRVRTIIKEKRVEVPVEKVVEKEVEVPVEKVIKEILYVPILTDDPDAVKRALASELPPEVAELVTMSSTRDSGRKSKGNAGKA